MKIKLKNFIFYLSLVVFIGIGLISCGMKKLEQEDGKIYLDSFDYDVQENDSAISNELSYNLSFQIGFSFDEDITIRDFAVKIEGKKSFRFTIDYCNTEYITLSPSTEEYPYAVLNYTIPKDTTSMEATVKLKISTVDLMDDINHFLTIQCSTDDGCQLVDKNDLLENGIFKMKYSSDTAIYYEFDEFSESYKVVSVITKSNLLEIPSMHNNHPVKTIDKGAFKATREIEKLILPETITALPEGLLNGMSQLKSLTIPFVGKNQTSTEHTHFGYLFGSPDAEKNSEYVPSSLEEVTITAAESIGSYAFLDCSNITSITIGNSVMSIGERAFSNCSSLKSMVIPESITCIELYTFSGCSSLEDISIPNSVTQIKNYAFSNCSSLTSIIIPDSVTSIGPKIFSGCSNLIKASIPAFAISTLPTTQLQDLSITRGTSINNVGYNNWINLKSITISNSVTSIDSGTFSNSKNLVKATIPTIAIPHILKNNLQELTINGGESISSNYFYKCSNLIRITIPESVTNISEDAFIGCYRLVEIYNYSSLDLTVGSTDNGSIAEYAKVIHTKEEPSHIIKTNEGYVFIKDHNEKYYLVAYEGLEKAIILPNDIEGNNYTINGRAFYNYSAITSIDIPASVINIGEEAFTNCSNIVKATIPANAIAYIPKEHLQEVIITSGETIGTKAFSNCRGLTNIVIPDSVTSIGSEAFSNCSSLTSIVIPDSVTDIGNFAFSNCNSLTSVTLSNSITNILYKTFSNCSSLTSIVIPDSVTSIGSNAFLGCTSLTSVVIPKDLINIGGSAFSGCSSLKTLFYKGSATDWEHISIGTNNSNLSNISIYYYSELQPNASGKYWHYVNGVVTKW